MTIERCVVKGCSAKYVSLMLELAVCVQNGPDLI